VRDFIPIQICEPRNLPARPIPLPTTARASRHPIILGMRSDYIGIVRADSEDLYTFESGLTPGHAFALLEIEVEHHYQDCCE